MNTEPRHTAIRADVAMSARQNAENARDLRDAIGSRPTQRVATVEPYMAVGSTSAKIPIFGSKLPAGVQLIQAAPYYDRGATLPLTPNHNFVWDSASETIGAFEPSGLVANTFYTLTFLVTEV